MTVTANNTQSNVTPIAAASKINQARELFTKISAENYVPADGSTPRKDFLAACIADLGMTENGASTYWQNCKNEADGKGLYKNAKAPTGEKRGRKADPAVKLRRAAAKVQKLRETVTETMTALAEAEGELVQAATGGEQQAG